MVSFRKLSINDLQDIQSLQQIVVADLEDPRILQPLSEEEFTNILNGNGLMIGVYDDEQLVAFRALLKPDPLEDEHLGADVKATDFTRVLYQEVSVVHPRMRGMRLQQKMGAFIMEQIDMSAYDWVCATVMPFNIASMKDKLAQGLFIRALKLKYGGKLRYIFGKQLNADERRFSEQHIVAMADTEQQQALLQQGYIGTAVTLTDDVWYVQYEK